MFLPFGVDKLLKNIFMRERLFFFSIKRESFKSRKLLVSGDVRMIESRPFRGKNYGNMICKLIFIKNMNCLLLNYNKKQRYKNRR